MTETPTEAVAGALRAEMARQRVDTREMASRLGKSRMWVSRRMNGEVVINIADAHELAGALGIEAEVLLTPSTP